MTNWVLNIGKKIVCFIINELKIVKEIPFSEARNSTLILKQFTDARAELFWF